jgi:hypothetical protein
VTAEVVPLAGQLAADRAIRRWVAATVPDLSAVDGSRALAVGHAAAPHCALLARRHRHVLLATGMLGGVAVVPGGGGTLRVTRRGVLEVEPQIDGRFDLVLAVNVLRRVDADRIVLPHLGWLAAPGGRLVAVDPVPHSEWAAVRSRYLTELPEASVDEVQPEVMGLRWSR